MPKFNVTITYRPVSIELEAQTPEDAEAICRLNKYVDIQSQLVKITPAGVVASPLPACCKECRGKGHMQHTMGSHSDTHGCAGDDVQCYCDQDECGNRNCNCHQ